MTVLTKREAWRRPASPARERAAELTPEERANLKRALRFLRVQVGSTVKLSAALHLTARTIDRGMGARPKGSALLAMRTARLVGVPLEDVLSGAWPGPCCPHCGR
jgi:hypothetical protein